LQLLYVEYILHIMEFGEHIRKAREALLATDRKFSLRQVALRIGIEPAYLSKIERGVFHPPSEEVIVKLAEILGEDKDVLLALAGKLSSDLQQIIRQRPQVFAQLLRQLREEPDHAILRVVREVKDGQW
jgi:HTH-type transcriptional regulator, competence development regulator